MSSPIAHYLLDFTALSVLFYSLKATVLVYLGLGTFFYLLSSMPFMRFPKSAVNFFSLHCWSSFGTPGYHLLFKKIFLLHGNLWRSGCGAWAGGAVLWFSRSVGMGQRPAVTIQSPVIFLPRACRLTFYFPNCSEGNYCLKCETYLNGCTHTHTNASTPLPHTHWSPRKKHESLEKRESQVIRRKGNFPKHQVIFIIPPSPRSQHSVITLNSV